MSLVMGISLGFLTKLCLIGLTKVFFSIGVAILFRRGLLGSLSCPAYGSKASMGLVKASEEKLPALFRGVQMDCCFFMVDQSDDHKTYPSPRSR